MSELKSCPFCGGDVDMLRAEVDEVGKVLYMPRCRECRAAILMKGQGEYTAYKSAEAAAAAWNTRHVETCKDEGGTGANGEQVFSCSECGCVLSLYDRDGSNNLCTGFVFDYPCYCPSCGKKVEQ